MKRLLTLLASALLLTAALCVSASAADYTSTAEELSAIGMFRGTVNGGFELDRAPRRSEAAIMLVRLYGAEEEAAAAYESGEISHPFRDVSKTASPYVAWLYTKGITKGVTATTFNSGAACSAKNYVVFLLRALGYQDGVDFQYADALDFAAGLGFYDDSLFGDGFLRDDLAAVTLQALATDKKGGETYLLKSLIDSGAVDAAKAKALTEKIEAYRALMVRAAAIAKTDALSARLTGAVSLNVLSTGKEEGEDYRLDSSFSLIPTGSLSIIEKPLQASLDAQIKMTGTANGSQDSTTASMQLWLKDSWVYLKADDGMGTTTSKKADVSEYLEFLQDALTQETEESGDTALAVSYAPLVMMDGITVKTVGGNTVYTLSFDGSLAGIYDPEDGNVTDEDGVVYTEKLNDAKLDITLTFNQSGVLTAMGVDAVYDRDSGVRYDADNYSQDSTKIHIQLAVTFTYGSAVSISFPNPAQFTTVPAEDLI